MRAVLGHGVLRIDDRPGAHWAVALLFVGVGAVFVLGPLGLFTNAGEVGWFARGASMVMGGCGVGAGLWIARTSPYSRLVHSQATGRVRITRVGTAGRSALEWPAAEVTSVVIAAKKDDDGDDVFQVRLALASGSDVPVSLLWSHDGDGARNSARLLGEALAVPVSP